jgi:hypothetical protein
MTTGYSSLTRREVVREIKTMRKTAARIASSRKKARAFLVHAGILSKNGKQLASKYR